MEIINKLQKEILSLFGDVLDSQYFYLTGGTALSVFYLMHRISNDLDFFTSNIELIVPFSNRLAQILKTKQLSVERRRETNSFIELIVEKADEKTVIHLAQDSAFRFEPVKEFSEYPNLKIDSFADISVNKLLALFGRATFRDFIDIYFLVKEEKFTIEELIEKAKIKDPGFDLYWLAVALERINTFNKDTPEILLLIKVVDFSKMVSFFNNWREKITEQFIR